MMETSADLRLRQAHRFNATPASQFRKLTSRYQSACIGCNRELAPGDSIMWSKDCGSCCRTCWRDLKGGSR